MTSAIVLLNGRYALGRLLGRGGFAEVYIAVDEQSHERVAVKLFRDADAGTERIASRLGRHPHIAQRRDQGTHDGRHFVVFDYVEGLTLRQRLQESKQLSSDEVSRLAAEIGSALDFAHRHGVLHNDLKPENIILSEDGAQLLDFGSARALDMTVSIEAAQELAGTVRYMAPEVLDGSEPTVQSDVYSFGLVLFEALTGRLPRLTMSSELTEPDASLPSGFSGAFGRALSPIPEMRQETAGALADALQPGAPTTVIDQPGIKQPGLIAVAGVRGTPRSGGVRRRLAFASAGLAILSGAIALGAATSFGRSSDGTDGTETPNSDQPDSAAAAATATVPSTMTPEVPSNANANADKTPKGKAKGKR